MRQHKHAELIKAWADGAEIEVYRPSLKCWKHMETPLWYDYKKYRIKPKPYATAGDIIDLSDSERSMYGASIDTRDLPCVNGLHESSIFIHRESLEEAESIRDRIIDMLNSGHQGKSYQGK